MSLQHRSAGLALHIKHDSYQIARRARAGLERKFIEQALEIDPELVGVKLEQKVRLIRSRYYTDLRRKGIAKQATRRNRQAGDA